LSAGYVYALINPSLDGLVKVGRTERIPEERALELSQGTGVPTPFIVAFQIWVRDCETGEAGVHAFLEMRGYRVNENREFFRAPLHVIVEAITIICGNSRIPHEPDPLRQTASMPLDRGPYTPQERDLIYDLQGSWRRGINGIGSYPDYALAIRSAKQLIALGAFKGHQMLGDAIRCKTSDPKAAEAAYRSGAIAGCIPCMLSIAELRDTLREDSRADQAWAIFFNHGDALVKSIHADIQRLIPIMGKEDLRQRGEMVDEYLRDRGERLDEYMYDTLEVEFVEPVFQYFYLRIPAHRKVNLAWLDGSYGELLKELFLVWMNNRKDGTDLEENRVATHVRELLT
jgi:hypothetical protein